jgi:hypothetical protein
MKRLIVWMVTLQVSTSAWAQGWIAFWNYLPPWIDAPVYDSDCTTPLIGSAYLSQVYGSLTQENYQPWGHIIPFNTPPPGGRGGFMAHAITIDIGGTSQGQIVYVQLRAWQASAGPTYEAAVAAGGKYGYSNVVPMPAYLAPSYPTFPYGLQSFCLFSGLPPKLTATVNGTGTVVLSWTVPSDGFLLQRTTNLLGTNWLTVPDAISIAGTNNQFKAPVVSGASLFYRLIHPKPSP